MRPPYRIDWSPIAYDFLVDNATRMGFRKIRRNKGLREAGTIATASEVGSILDRASIPWWLSYGALLGIVRDGQFLEDDNDIDIVIDPGIPPETVSVALVTAGAVQIANIRHGSTVTNQKFWYNDLYVDIYYSHVRQGRLVDFSRFSGCVVLLEHERQETKQITHGGVSFRIPNAPETYLKKLYGPGWTTRDPDWIWYLQQDVVEIRGRPWNLARCFFWREVQGPRTLANR